jgi:hypothetical protein
VYEHLERLTAHAREHGLEVHRATGGDIRDLVREGGALDAPYFLQAEDGSSLGMASRQCTRYLKIRPMRRVLRSLMRECGATTATQVFGISADEFHRMRKPDVAYLEHAYPLVDLRMTREDCKRYLAERWPWPVPRSACIGCPYHSDHEWRAMRDERPAEWEEAQAFERMVQAHAGGSGRLAQVELRGTPYLHRQRVPLEQVDLTTPEDHGQLSLLGAAGGGADALGFLDECEGMCGV